MEKTIVAVATLYKGFLIFQTRNGFCIYDGDGNRIPFESQAEAEAYADAIELAVVQ